MAESAIFILLSGIIVIGVMVVFNIQNFDPRIIMGLLTLLLLPGFYAAVAGGPFVPSTKKRHKAMLLLAGITSSDIVYDVGCGDGRLVFEAAKNAKKAIGYELSIPLYLFGIVKQFLSRSKGEIRYGNIWKQDYRDADVIFCYLLPHAMQRFYAEIWPHLKPGTRVVSNAFQIHDLKPLKKEEKVYLYRV